jgi:Reverse transcriptase (RNA-dependent DNA polymerase)
MSTKANGSKPFVPYKKKKENTPPASHTTREHETTKFGRSVSSLPSLWPTKGANLTNVIGWMNAILPYIGNNTSPRVQSYLKKKEFNEAPQTVKTKEQEREMSKTEIAILIDENKENRINNQQDHDHLKIAFNILMGNISKASIDLLKSYYLDQEKSVPWDSVLQEQDAISLIIAIEATHLAPTSGVTAIRAAEHTRMLLSISANQNESISDYRQRLETIAEGGKVYNIQFAQDVLTAIMFLGLPNEYAPMKKELINADSLKSAQFPKSLIELERIASDWIADVTPKTTAATVLMNVQDRSDYHKAKTIAAKQAKAAAADSIKKAIPTSNSPTQEQIDAIKLPTSPPTRRCDCGDEHYTWDCSKKSVDEKNALVLKYKTNKARGRKNVHFTTTNALLGKPGGGRSGRTLLQSPPGNQWDDNKHQGVEDHLTLTLNDGYTTYSNWSGAKLNELRKRLSVAEKAELENELWLRMMETNSSRVNPSQRVLEILKDLDEDERMMLFQSYINDMIHRKTIFKVSKDVPNLTFLDTGADTQITNDESILSNIQACEAITVNHVHDRALINQSGTNVALGEMYYDQNFPASIVSLSYQIDNGNKVFYNSDEDAFQLYNPNLNLSIYFVRYGGLYACENQAIRIANKSVLFTSVEDKKKLYSVRQIAAADKALELLNEHCISTRSGIKLFSHVKDFPLTTQDFLRAAVIYGQDCECYRVSTAVLKKPPPLNPEKLLYEPGDIALNIDIMHVPEIPFPMLASVGVPTHYSQVTMLKSRSYNDVEKAIDRHSKAFTKYKRNVQFHLSDGEPAVTKMEAVSTIQSRFDIQGGSHVSVVEQFIRRAKEKWRGFVHTSGYDILKIYSMLLGIVLCALAMKINYPPCDSNYESMSRFQSLTQQDVMYHHHLALSPMKPVSVYQPKKDVGYNSSARRSIEAIAIQPMDTLRGAWRFINLQTGKFITREQWFPRPLDESFKQKVYNLIPVTNDPSAIDVFGTKQDYFEIDNSFKPAVTTVEESRAEVGDIDRPDDLMRNMYEFRPGESVPQSEWEYETPEKMKGSNLLMEFDQEDTSQVQALSDIRTQQRRDFSPILSRVFMTVRAANNKFGEDVVSPTKVSEVSQLLTKQVFRPVYYHDLSEKQKKEAIRTTMTIDDKYKPDGSFDKLKARLVGMQYKWLTEMDSADIHAPTVHIQHVLMMATIAASEKRDVRVIDVSGAFLNADVQSIGQVIILEPEAAKIAAALQPEMKQYVRPNGTIYCILNKALYGTRTAAKAWYNLVVSTLKGNGFHQNAYDPCVFNKIVDAQQISIAFHVDDFLLTSTNSEALDEVEALFTKAFNKITKSKGKVINYLGMTFDFSNEGKVHVNQLGYIIGILDESRTTRTAHDPALEDLRVVNPQSPKLSESKREEFHSMVAKLLFLSHRTRIDILLPVQFLSTRVTIATEEDQVKLNRVLHYLNYTRHLGLVLSANKPTEILAYIDAAYGVHNDRKSHTGVVTSLGGGSIYSSSTSQSINTTSSSESELVGLSDGIKPVLFMRNFLIEQGYTAIETTVFQDNMSTINLVNNGIGNSNKSRHIDIRYFFVTDRLKQGHLRVKHLGTSDMIADILTKPLTGTIFAKLRDLLLGYTTL